MSSGNIITGLTVEGDIGFEVAKDEVLENFMASAMLNEWDTKIAQIGEISINGATNTIEFLGGDDFLASDLNVGDFVTLSGFDTAANNIKVIVTEIVSSTEIKVVSKTALVTETKVGASFKRADRLTIGTSPKSFSMEKTFLDLANKALIYRGMVANTMSLNVSYGEILNGSFGFNGTDYQEADLAVEFISNGRTINPPATTNSLNGSVDMPVLITSATGPIGVSNFCIQSLEVSLNNNYSAQNCIGKAAAVNFTPGMAEIEVNLSSYLSDINWSILAKKLTQTPFSVGFAVENFEGWYGFFFPALQVSFPDPASGGANQEVSLDMQGVARVGLNGESAMTIYRG